MEKSAVPPEVLWTSTFLNFVHDHNLITVRSDVEERFAEERLA